MKKLGMKPEIGRVDHHKRNLAKKKIQKLQKKTRPFLGIGGTRAIQLFTFTFSTDAIAKALEAVAAGDAKGWFESCGYTNAVY